MKQFKELIYSKIESRRNPFGILVALKSDKEDSHASGELYWDDGESLGID